MEGKQELDEALEKAKDPWERRIGASMAIVAAALALVSVAGHISTTEEILSQQKASDQWAFYQSKAIRRYQSEAASDVLAAVKGSEAAAKRYRDDTVRSEKETEQIQEKAREFERESASHGRRALRLHVGEIFLEIAIVFSSLALLTRRRMFWWTGMAGGALGTLVALTVLVL